MSERLSFGMRIFVVLFVALVLTGAGISASCAILFFVSLMPGNAPFDITGLEWVTLLLFSSVFCYFLVVDRMEFGAYFDKDELFKIDLDWMYLYLGKDGVHFEMDLAKCRIFKRKIPWLVISLSLIEPLDLEEDET